MTVGRFDALGQYMVDFGDTVTGDGVAGRITQWATQTTLEESTLIKTGAGVITLGADGTIALDAATSGSVVVGSGVTNRMTAWQSQWQVRDAGFAVTVYDGPHTLNIYNGGDVAMVDGGVSAPYIAQWANGYSLGESTLQKLGLADLYLYTRINNPVTAHYATSGSVIVGGGVANRLAMFTDEWSLDDAPHLYYSTAQNYFGIGTTQPVARFHVYEDTVEVPIVFQSAVNDHAEKTMFLLRRTRADSTAPNAGFGVALAYSLEVFTNGTTVNAGAIGVVWENNQTNDTTDRDSAMIFRTMLDNSLSEKMRMTSAGFLGVGVSAPLTRFHAYTNTAVYTGTFQNDTPDHTAYGTIEMIRSRSDGTAPNAGFGTSIVAVLEGFTNGQLPVASSIQTVWEANQTNDTTARDSALIFYTMLDNSLAEKFRLTSGGEARFSGLARLNGQTGFSIQMRSVTVNNAATAQLLNTASVQAYVIILNNQTAAWATYTTQGGLATTQELLDPAGTYTITAGTGSRTNIYWSVGNARYEIQNNTGIAVTYYMFYVVLE